ncbi:hypothetical protein PoB_006053500 [Plakobranchus ocellatus]|uniref:Uncharacterized protein n=1 Tax=Plakobranchus ocellatus TaxID=259542 RepID=A0AAV4CQA2_9GAST|nr:hypothetical protein PoB_006053500 [Plakobranchus ocellatus]
MSKSPQNQVPPCVKRTTKAAALCAPLPLIVKWVLGFLYIASPSGQGAGSGARTRDRRVPADLRADSQATVLPTPPIVKWKVKRKRRGGTGK